MSVEESEFNLENPAAPKGTKSLPLSSQVAVGSPSTASSLLHPWVQALLCSRQRPHGLSSYVSTSREDNSDDQTTIPLRTFCRRASPSAPPTTTTTTNRSNNNEQQQQQRTLLLLEYCHPSIKSLLEHSSTIIEEHSQAVQLPISDLLRGVWNGLHPPFGSMGFFILYLKRLVMFFSAVSRHAPELLPINAVDIFNLFPSTSYFPFTTFADYSRWICEEIPFLCLARDGIDVQSDYKSNTTTSKIPMQVLSSGVLLSQESVQLMRSEDFILGGSAMAAGGQNGFEDGRWFLPEVSKTLQWTSEIVRDWFNNRVPTGTSSALDEHNRMCFLISLIASGYLLSCEIHYSRASGSSSNAKKRLPQFSSYFPTTIVRWLLGLDANSLRELKVRVNALVVEHASPVFQQPKKGKKDSTSSASVIIRREFANQFSEVLKTLLLSRLDDSHRVEQIAVQRASTEGVPAEGNAFAAEGKVSRRTGKQPRVEATNGPRGSPENISAPMSKDVPPIENDFLDLYASQWLDSTLPSSSASRENEVSRTGKNTSTSAAGKITSHAEHDEDNSIILPSTWNGAVLKAPPAAEPLPPLVTGGGEKSLFCSFCGSPFHSTAPDGHSVLQVFPSCPTFFALFVCRNGFAAQAFSRLFPSVEEKPKEKVIRSSPSANESSEFVEHVKDIHAVKRMSTGEARKGTTPRFCEALNSLRTAQPEFAQLIDHVVLQLSSLEPNMSRHQLQRQVRDIAEKKLTEWSRVEKNDPKQLSVALFMKILPDAW